MILGRLLGRLEWPSAALGGFRAPWSLTRWSLEALRSSFGFRRGSMDCHGPPATAAGAGHGRLGLRQGLSLGQGPGLGLSPGQGPGQGLGLGQSLGLNQSIGLGLGLGPGPGLGLNPQFLKTRARGDCVAFFNCTYMIAQGQAI